MDDKKENLISELIELELLLVQQAYIENKLQELDLRIEENNKKLKELDAMEASE